MTKKTMTGVAALLLVLVAGSVGACNTVAGFGEDVQHGGRAIEREADKAK